MTRTAALCILWGVTLLAPVRAISAQAARPDFKSLRFDEHWTAADRSSRWDDAIKAIPLAPALPLTLTLGGQLRWREEFVRAHGLSDRNDDLGQSRLQLSADLQAGHRDGLQARLFVEGRDAQSYGRTLPGGTRPSDADRHDIQNLFGEVGAGRSYLRYGRQEIATNRERMFGVPDWANTRRGAEGTRLQLVRGSLAFEAMDARPVLVRQEAANRADPTDRFRVLSLGNSMGAAPLVALAPTVWQGYWIEQVIDQPDVRTRRLTSGGRALWQWDQSAARRGYSLELEGAVQRGRAGALDLRGWFWVAESQVRWRGVHGAPSLAVGVEAASGEDPSTVDTREVFTTLYPAAHVHGGFADVIGRPNVRELHVIGTWAPVAAVSLRGAWYRFDRLRTTDGVWSKQNTLFRAADGSLARHAADEFDLTGEWKLSRHLRVIAGGAVVLPGAFLQQSAAGASTERWAFVGTAFTF